MGEIFCPHGVLLEKWCNNCEIKDLRAKLAEQEATIAEIAKEVHGGADSCSFSQPLLLCVRQIMGEVTRQRVTLSEQEKEIFKLKTASASDNLHYDSLLKLTRIQEAELARLRGFVADLRKSKGSSGDWVRHVVICGLMNLDAKTTEGGT
jgi:hypothetical protein